MFWASCQLLSYIYTAHLRLPPLPLLLSVLLHGSQIQSLIPQSSPTHKRWYCIIKGEQTDWNDTKDTYPQCLTAFSSTDNYSGFILGLNCIDTLTTITRSHKLSLGRQEWGGVMEGGGALEVTHLGLLLPVSIYRCWWSFMSCSGCV